MRSFLLVVAGALFAALILSSPAPGALEAAPLPAPRIDTLSEVRVTPLEHYTDPSCTVVRVRLQSADGERVVSLNLDGLERELELPDGE